MAFSTPLFGFLGLAVSALSFSLMSSLVLILEDQNAFVLSLFRFVVGIAVVLTLYFFQKKSLVFNSKLLLFTRGVLGAVSTYFYYWSIDHLGLATGTLISNTYPFFAVILGSIFLKEKLKFRVLALFLLALLGVGLISGFDWTHGAILKTQWIGGLAALLGALMAGIAVVSIKALTKTDAPEIIFLSQCLWGLWFVFLPATGSIHIPKVSTASLLLLMGLLAALGQISMTWSFKRVSLASGSLMGFVLALLNSLIGLVFFKEQWSSTQWLGSGLLMLACFSLVIWEMSQAASEKKNF